MKLLTRLNVLCLLLISLWSSSLWAQTITRPVDLSLSLQGNMPIFLEEYATRAILPMNIRMRLDDLNEVSRDVYINIRIEGNSTKIVTAPGFRPEVPITLFAGQNTTLTASDLSTYFQSNHLSYTGVLSGNIQNGASIPEGIYMFDVEVLDYQTGELLSTEMAPQIGRIMLNDPPKIIGPNCGEVAKPYDPQRLSFSWQASGGTQRVDNLAYRLLLYQLNDPKADPKYALYNNKAQLFYQTQDPITSTIFQYDVSLPELEIGKIYIYQVQAYDDGQIDLQSQTAAFRNAGKSEVCWFRYGYPEGGKLKINSPENEMMFGKRDAPEFVWEAPDNRIPEQPFSYELRVVEVNPEQSLEEALEFNPTYQKKLLAETKNINGGKYVLQGDRFKAMQKYAWQVYCYSGIQEVAKSDAQIFFGPMLIEEFDAGGHTVKIQEITDANMNGLAGVAKFKISKNKYIKGTFSGVEVADESGTETWLLKSGAVKFALDGEIDDIALSPMEKRNGEAFFRPDSVMLNVDGLWLGGKFEWTLPHATESGDKPMIVSRYGFVPYNFYRLNGTIYLPEDGYEFELLDPTDYTLTLSGESHIFLLENNYELKFFGDVSLPNKFTSYFSDEEISVPFFAQEQLFYMALDNVRMPYDFRLTPNGNVFLRPTYMELDLDETHSPQRMQYDLNWKGVYFKQFELDMLKDIDDIGQLKASKGTERFTKVVNLNQGASDVKAWFSRTGLQFFYDRDMAPEDSVQMHRFASHFDHFYMDIENSLFKKGQIDGSFLIPFLSTEKSFTFTIPISYDGFSLGYFNADMVGKTFMYNEESKDQKVSFTVTRAVYQDLNHIDMTIDFVWPSLEAEIKSIPHLKVWGNHAVGFDVPNGVYRLDMQENGFMHGFPITVETLSIGCDQEAYSFAAQGKINIGEDVTGSNGGTDLNVYSVVKNPYAPRVAFSKKVDLSSLKAGNEEEEEKLLKEQEEFEAGFANISEVSDEAQKILDGIVVKEVSINDVIKSKGALENLKKYDEDDEGDDTELTNDGGSSSKAMSYVSVAEDLAKSKGKAVAKKQVELLIKVVDELVDTLMGPYIQKLGDYTKDVNKKVEEIISTPFDEGERLIEDKLEGILSIVETKLGKVANKAPNVKVGGISLDLSEVLNRTIREARSSTTKQIKSAYTTSINENIVSVFTSIIQISIQEKLIGNLQDALTKNGLKVMMGKGSFNDAINDITKTLASSVEEIFQEVWEEVISPDAMKSMILNTAKGLIKNIDPMEIVNDASKELLDAVKEQTKGQVAEKGKEMAQAIISEKLDVDIPIDFFDAGQALINGKPQDVFKTDVVPFEVRNSVIEVKGMLEFKDKDPVYGDAFMAKDLDVVIKLSKKNILIKAMVIKGRKDDLAYWMLSAGASASASSEEASKMEAGKPGKTSNLVKIGPVEINTLGATVAKNMSFQAGQWMPDASQEIFANLQIGMSAPALEIFVDGTLDKSTNGTKIELYGHVNVKGGLVEAETYIMINTEENHFLCNTYVEVNKENTFCANGEFSVETKPGFFQVNMGTRENYINVTPGCAGWGAAGWLEITKTYAEVGAGISYSINAETPSIPLAIFLVKVGVDAGFAAMVFAQINYKPLRINEAGLILELWANVYIKYRKIWQKKKKEKRKNIVDIYARGDFVMRFNPKPTKLTGKVKGYVKVLGMGFNFKAGFSKTFG